ncbi:transglycosylase SLT domain-containing protein [Desulfonatronovibrio magnus]|uniref:transglycosylase SLT domain-containing protein n=1 Tax=Desulfonatronovibrio magnus TaxID=698827 RepID=UPI000B292276|nr:transglycosylase SLT domain-containing protein [Desulfonatronovibrio magnus]
MEAFKKISIIKHNIHKHKIILILILTLILFVLGYVYFQKYYWSQDRIRILYLESERSISSLSPYGKGFEWDLADYFSSIYGLKPVWVKIDDFNKGIEQLQSGRANLLISEPLLPDLSWDNVVRGPGYLSGNFIITHNRWRYPLKNIQDLCNFDTVAPGRFLFSQKIALLQDNLNCEIEVSNSLNPGKDFFNMISQRDFRFGLIDELNFDLWHSFFLDVFPSYSLSTSTEHAWLWSAKYKDMDRKFTEFWEEIFDDPYLYYLKEKYFGFFPAEKDTYQLNHFITAIETKLPQYADYILTASQEYNIDPLLLTVLIYQESHFDPVAQSSTGVQGLMQITLETADFLGVTNRLDPEQSIMGGAKYLNFLMERVVPTGAESWDKWFLTLAAYNQGLGHLYDAMELAERKGVNRLHWLELKQIYPLLSFQRYYETLPRGYARGFEAVHFVENIRYYYYILYGMISLARPEAEHLGRFLRFVPSNWPD